MALFLAGPDRSLKSWPIAPTKLSRAAWQPAEIDWARLIGHGQTTNTVVVKQPEVEHKVRMRDFKAWVESNDRPPAEMALRSRLRELLSK